MILAGLSTALVLSGPGCGGHRLRKESDRVPYRGLIDPDQARELDKTTMPRYVVEPPDELDVTVKPLPADWAPSSFVVQADGLVDLGLYGDVYVVGLTLDQIEEKVAQQLTLDALKRGQKPSEPYRVSVRLSASQSKHYYVLGTVGTEGKFPIKGNETALDAILLAGLKSNSLPEKAYLVRPHSAGGVDQVLRIDWCAIKDRGDTLTNYQLFPGDRIVVPGTRPPSLIATLLGR
ncbi:Polysaccharide biosynthesis/export protein [Planctomyces sp. SH-PL62]|nr:Polysaccharide biosynthesis/export protein [Planctomyces sp. SH-PL62]